jgi:aminopeptidase-like protein
VESIVPAENDKEMEGEFMLSLIEELFLYNRSLTGSGVVKTLKTLKDNLNPLEIKTVKTGTKCFDWTVPKEWSISAGYIIGPNGDKIVDFNDSNLHVVGYSIAVNKCMPLKELQNHLHSLPEQPDAIPYVTSYYEENWGFCLTDEKRKALIDGEYTVYIDSKHFDGQLTYGELLIPGKVKKEVFFSTYVCHPSMANNELSGPAVVTALSKWLLGTENLYYTYRILFIPETIGSIFYISKNLKKMKKNIVLGYNVTCVGDEGDYSYIPSRQEDTISDRLMKNILKHEVSNYKQYSFLDRGSDERQFCSPGVDLPIVTFCRSKFGEYPEYHTSLDNLDFISKKGLFTSFSLLQKVVKSFESNLYITAVHKCEPHLSKYKLYPALSTKKSKHKTRDMTNFLTYSDGRSLLDIADKIDMSIVSCIEILNILEQHGLVKKIQRSQYFF